MNNQPNISLVASAISEPARAEMLGALMGGQAFTATEMADVASVTRQTASSHLAKLLHAGLIEQRQQGKHKYFRLASEDVASMLESLMGIAGQANPSSPHFFGPKNPLLREARVCYDHLAGRKGVWFFEQLIKNHLLDLNQNTVSTTGRQFFKQYGLDVDLISSKNRKMCRSCLDWSERRDHLAGALGHAWLHHMLAAGWCKRGVDDRVLTFTHKGEQSFNGLFGG